VAALPRHDLALRVGLTLAALALGVCIVALGAGLLPGPAAAATRGVSAQLVLTWVLIAGTTLAAVFLVIVLVVRRPSGLGTRGSGLGTRDSCDGTRGDLE